MPWEENKNGFHGKPVDDAGDAIRELGGLRNPGHRPTAARRQRRNRIASTGWPAEPADATSWARRSPRARPTASALAALGKADPEVVALDGEVGNSTYTETFAKAIPERFFQMYIAEQQMIGAAVGMQVRGWKPFAATFAAFLSRAYDFVRMAAV